jgi:hypothetical protein
VTGFYSQPVACHTLHPHTLPTCCCTLRSLVATTQYDILNTGICTGWFATYDPCQALPQFNYSPCGIQLKGLKRQQLQITSAGGFDVWLDMRTTDRKGICMIARRRSRRMLQDPLDAIISKPLISMRPPTLQEQGQQIIQTSETVADSPTVNDSKPTTDLSPAPEPLKPEPLDSPNPYSSTEPQPSSSPSSPFPWTWSSPDPVPWWLIPGYSPAPRSPGFEYWSPPVEDSPKPYPLDSPDPDTKPLESPWPWFWNSPKPDPPLDSPLLETLVSPGMNPDYKPSPPPIPYWWYHPLYHHQSL